MPNHLMTSRLAGSLLALVALAGLAQSQSDTTPAPATQPAPAAQAPATQAPAAQAPAAQAPAVQPAPAAQQPAAAKPSMWDLLKSGDALAKGDGVTKDTAKAREIFEQVMASDNKQAAGAAAFALGKLAAGDLNDPKLAASAFDRGIELGNVWSMINRAQGLAKGDAKDQKRALALYNLALETDPSPGVQMGVNNALGQLYLTPGMLSAKKATEYLQRSVDLGNPWSLMALGGIYEKGTGTKRNWAKARDYYEKALAVEVPQVKGAAALGLARLYVQPGHSSPKKSITYLQLGQKYGSPWASIQLADRYLQGLGVKKSTATGRRMLTELRNGPDPDVARAAAFKLGRSYTNPPGRNLKLAEENLKYASGKGDAWGSYFLAQLYIKDLPSKANRRKARELLRTLAKNEDATVRKSANTLLKQMR